MEPHIANAAAQHMSFWAVFYFSFVIALGPVSVGLMFVSMLRWGASTRTWFYLLLATLSLTWSVGTFFYLARQLLIERR